jgi:hypothetical protein
MATTEQGTIQQRDEQMDKLRISNGRVQAAPLGPARRAEYDSAPDAAQAQTQDAGPSPDNGGTVLSADLRRNFIIPPKERALECIAVLLTLARSNLGTSQRNLHAARRAQDDKNLAHWKWESLHWLRRCGKWSNHKRKVESR